MRNIENGRKYLERIIDDRKKNFDYNDALCYVDAFLKHRKEYENGESTFTGILFYFLKWIDVYPNFKLLLWNC